jgi:FlaA1/EpsC-like NDP-sugar epimerase
MNRNRIIQKYVLFDMLASLIVWVLFMLFRRTVNDAQIFEGARIFIPNYDYFSALFLFPFCCAFVHYLSGFYLNPIKQSRFTTLFTTFISSAIISITIFFALLLDDLVVSYEYYYYSLFVLFVLLFGFTSLFRIVIDNLVLRNYETKKWTINTLVIGTGESALKITNELENIETN